MKNTQDPIKLKDLEKFLTYASQGDAATEKERKFLHLMSRRTVNVSDVMSLFNVMNQRTSNLMTQLMDVVQIHKRVLSKVGATDEMYKEAEAEYEQLITEKQAELLAAQKQMKEEKAAEGAEDNR